MSQELHTKILSFLLGEFAKKENHVCVSLELMFHPGNMSKDDTIREWIRQDDAEMFEPARLPEFVSLIMDAAETEADAKPPGNYTFYLRTKQYFGTRQKLSFALRPNYTGEDSSALAISAGASGRTDGSAQALQVLANHANQFMRTNTQMFDGALKAYILANERLGKQNAELHAENILLRREVDEARSNKFEREYAISKEVRTEQRTAASWKQAMNIAGVVAAKIAGGVNGAPGIAGPASASALTTLLGNFRDSIRPEQFQSLFSILDQIQLMMLNEIMSFAPPQQEAAAPPQEAAQNGAPSP